MCIQLSLIDLICVMLICVCVCLRVRVLKLSTNARVQLLNESSEYVYIFSKIIRKPKLNAINHGCLPESTTMLHS